TMLPWIKMWEEELNFKMLTPAERDRGLEFKYSVKGLLRADVSTRANFYQTMTNVRAITPNEIRDLEDMNPAEWGSEPLMSRNFYAPGELDATVD
ncbi:phage portal protein, partial [Arthrospira platensis SPKY1]|nr:phage portal protein [Arthrospira platensis SPKY1]